MCRAVLCDAFIYQFRSFKGVFVLTGIAVSFIFGFLHVAGSPVNNPLMLAQAVLKTVSTGILGFSLLMNPKPVILLIHASNYLAIQRKPLPHALSVLLHT